MGLDFGFAKISKELWISFNQDKEKFSDYFYAEEHEDEINYFANWCGWGNPIERWFKDAFDYYQDYDGFLMRALDPEDIYAAMNEAYSWYKHNIGLEPVVLGSAFNEAEDGTITIKPIDGVEIADEDGAYHRFYSEDSNGRLFITKDWIDSWDIYKFPEFIHEMVEILQNFDWNNDVLLYYVSY